MIINIFIHVFFFLGDSSSLSSFPYLERHSLALLTITFSFFTVIYLMNLFIGLLNNAIEVNNDHANYLIEKSRVCIYFFKKKGFLKNFIIIYYYYY